MAIAIEILAPSRSHFYKSLNSIRFIKKIIMSALDPLPENSKNKIVCCYVNATSKIQIARITDVANWYYEKVVFPGQHLIFEAVQNAHLEIHSGMMASSILSDTIPCVQLQVEESAPAIPSWLPIASTHVVEPHMEQATATEVIT
jgi:hypothetical protein